MLQLCVVKTVADEQMQNQQGKLSMKTKGHKNRKFISRPKVGRKGRRGQTKRIRKGTNRHPV